MKVLSVLKKIVPTALISGVIMGSFMAHAGQEGHGGDGYYVNNKLYLVDLYEANAHMNPYLGKDDTVIDSRMLQVAQKLIKDDKKAASILAKKMTEIDQKFSLLGQLLVGAAEHYKFRFVPSELVNVRDTCSIMKLDSDLIVQLAIRKGNIISIADEYWKELNSANKAALMLHELIFPLQTKYPCSDATRAVVGELFSSNFSSYDMADIARISFDMTHTVYFNVMDTIVQWYGPDTSIYQKKFKFVESEKTNLGYLRSTNSLGISTEYSNPIIPEDIPVTDNDNDGEPDNISLEQKAYTSFLIHEDNIEENLNTYCSGQSKYEVEWREEVKKAFGKKEKNYYSRKFYMQPKEVRLTFFAKDTPMHFLKDRISLFKDGESKDFYPEALKEVTINREDPEKCKQNIREEIKSLGLSL